MAISSFDNSFYKLNYCQPNASHDEKKKKKRKRERKISIDRGIWNFQQKSCIALQFIIRKITLISGYVAWPAHSPPPHHYLQNETKD